MPSSSRLTRFLRATHLVIHLCRGLLTAAIVLPRVSTGRRDAIIRAWCRKLLTIFNIRLAVFGAPPGSDAKNVLFVANHVSWIDIYAINSVRAVRFVAKSEIRRWPVFGWLAAQVNTLFTDRERRHDAGRMVEVTTSSLRAGDCLCYFPEGVTTTGIELKPFKSSLIQAAINAEGLIWPVAIRYPGADGQPDTGLSYANVSLLSSICTVLTRQSPVVELHFSEPVKATGYDRRQLAFLARVAIARQLDINP